MNWTELRWIVYLLWTRLSVSNCTHFRGSMISWRVVNDSSSPLEIEILQRHAWRYTYYNTPPCSAATIPSGLPLLGNSSYKILCVATCPTNLTVLGSVQVPCTGFNTGEQYAMGEGRFRFKVPQNVSFIATFNESAWFVLVTGSNLPWSVAVQIQTFRRPDTGRYNNAPVITMLPIYRLRNLVSYSIKINVADNDYDPYVCLWSRGTIQTGGLSNSVPGALIDNYGCYVNFTPSIVGFYAVPITAEDFAVLPVNVSASNYLSQVPIQFIFNVYSSANLCVRGPIYIGDIIADTCIYMSVGSNYTARIRFRVQCANASVTSIISVNPTGLFTTSIQQDPFDATIFTFLAYFTSNAQQIGQNLFCFSAVDSIGNQGDSACLRFAVESQTSSLQTLYMQNATRYPMGTVSKTTSTWTILTGAISYSRPSTEAYIRFRRVSDNADYYVLNVVTGVDKVAYLSDRIVITSNVVWTPGEYFYIYMDGGIFTRATTCNRDSMPIGDPTFWPFDIPYESTVTSTTSTSTTSISSTTTMRSVPTRRRLITIVSTTSTTMTTATSVISPSTFLLTSTVAVASSLSISAIVGITLGSLILVSLLASLGLCILRVCVIRTLLLRDGLRQHLLSQRTFASPRADPDSKLHYKLATHSRKQVRASTFLISNDDGHA